MLQFAVFAVIFLSIGILLVVKNNEVQEISIKYDSLCRDELQSGKYCTINLKEITKEMKGPVYIYYELSGFYQNHRRYVKSRDDGQLAGGDFSISELSQCDPII